MHAILPNFISLITTLLFTVVVFFAPYENCIKLLLMLMEDPSTQIPFKAFNWPNMRWLLLWSSYRTQNLPVYLLRCLKSYCSPAVDLYFWQSSCSKSVFCTQHCRTCSVELQGLVSTEILRTTTLIGQFCCCSWCLFCCKKHLFLSLV